MVWPLVTRCWYELAVLVRQWKNTVAVPDSVGRCVWVTKDTQVHVSGTDGAVNALKTGKEHSGIFLGMALILGIIDDTKIQRGL